MVGLRLVTAMLSASLAAGCATGEGQAADPDPIHAVLERSDLQELVEAGLDRRTGPLLEALRSGDEAARAVAARSLASVEDTSSTRLLIGALRDPSPAVRREAAIALGQLGSEAAGPALLGAISEESSPATRGVMAEAVGKVGGAGFLERLLALVEEGEPELPLALYHFGRRGVFSSRAGATLLQALGRDDPVQAEAAALAIASGRRGEGWSLTIEEIRNAANALPTGSGALVPLLGLLGRDGDARDVSLLTACLTGSPSWRVRRAAALALGNASSASEVETALFAALDDPSPHVATAAASALAQRLFGEDPHAQVATADSLARWIREHPEKPAVGAALLPALIGTPEETLAIEFARGEVNRDAGWFAYGALSTSDLPAAETVLLEGLRGDRRGSYAAATALADRIQGGHGSAALSDSVARLLVDQLPRWSALAPASDARGAARLSAMLLADRPAAFPELRRVVAAHPHAMIRAAVDPSASGAGEIPRSSVDWELLRSAGPRPRLGFTTKHGEFIVELESTRAPLSASMVLEAVEAGRFDHLPFHRVEGDFILQSGDLGGEEQPAARSEFDALHFDPGTLGIASSGKDTEGPQYFITHGPALSLDGRYTALGRMVSGQEVADAVALGDTVTRVHLLRTSEN